MVLWVALFESIFLAFATDCDLVRLLDFIVDYEA